MSRRTDDSAAKVTTRLKAYHELTKPLLPYYRARGVLHKVDGMADMDDVGRQIEAVLAKVGAVPKPAGRPVPGAKPGAKRAAKKGASPG